MPHSNCADRRGDNDRAQEIPRSFPKPPHMQEKLDDGEMQYVETIGKVTIFSKVPDVQK